MSSPPPPSSSSSHATSNSPEQHAHPGHHLPLYNIPVTGSAALNIDGSAASTSVESSYAQYHAYSAFVPPPPTTTTTMSMSSPYLGPALAHPSVPFVDVAHQHVSTAAAAASNPVVLNTLHGTPSTAALLDRHRQSQQGEGHRTSGQRNRSALRLQSRLSNENTLQWLADNYESRVGICLPRCMLYSNYRDYMSTQQRDVRPIGPAAFGKLVRQMFPTITTRRLGTRGQSKYHYYGIMVKTTSVYFEQARRGGDFSMRCDTGPATGRRNNNRNANNNRNHQSRSPQLLDESSDDHTSSDGHDEAQAQGMAMHAHIVPPPQQQLHHAVSIEREQQQQQGGHGLPDNYGLEPRAVVTSVITSSAAQAQLAGTSGGMGSMSGGDISCSAQFKAKYPSVADFKDRLTKEVSVDLLNTFLIMYQQHSSRVLDTFQLANATELEKTVIHFWNEMPEHLAPLMADSLLVDIIESVDTLLYQCLETMLRNIAMKPDMSVTFIRDVRLILSRMDIWVNTALAVRNCRMSTIIFAYNTHKIHGRHINKAELSVMQTNTVSTLTNNQINLLLECKRKTFNVFAEIVRLWLSLHLQAKECRAMLSSPEMCGHMLEHVRMICQESGRDIVATVVRQTWQDDFDRNEHDQDNPLSVAERSSVAMLLKQFFTDIVHTFLYGHNTSSGGLESGLEELPFDSILYLLAQLAHTCLTSVVDNVNKEKRVVVHRVVLNRYNTFNKSLMHSLFERDASAKVQWNQIFVCFATFFELELCRYNRIADYEMRRGVLMGKIKLDGNYGQVVVAPPQGLVSDTYLDEDIYAANGIKPVQTQVERPMEWFKEETTEYFGEGGQGNVNYEQHQHQQQQSVQQTHGYEQTATNSYAYYQPAHYNPQHQHMYQAQQLQQYYGQVNHYHQQQQQQQQQQSQSSEWIHVSDPVSEESYYDRLVIDESAASNPSSPGGSHHFAVKSEEYQSVSQGPMSAVAVSHDTMADSNVYTCLP